MAMFPLFVYGKYYPIPLARQGVKLKKYEYSWKNSDPITKTAIYR